MSSLRHRDPRERDRAYLGWVARLPCLACMVHGTVNWGVQVAHVRAASLEHDKRYTGKGEKPSDRWVLPLCQPHHTGDRRRAPVAQHDMDELEFWALFGIEPFSLCIELRACFERGGVGVTIISKAAAAGRRAIDGGFMDEQKVRATYIAGQADGSIPFKALSIKQPWAWLIVNGHKDIENRDWLKRFPKRILVHTGQSADADAHGAMVRSRHPVTGKPLDPRIYDAYIDACKLISPGISQPPNLGGFVGMVDITGVQEDHDSPWFVGDYGYILANGRPLPFLPWRGVLGFFDAKVTP